MANDMSLHEQVLEPDKKMLILNLLTLEKVTIKNISCNFPFKQLVMYPTTGYIWRRQQIVYSQQQAENLNKSQVLDTVRVGSGISFRNNSM